MIVHLGVAFIFRKVKDYDYNNFIFRIRKWEKKGLIYEKIFMIKRWKKLLPSGDELFKNLPHKNLLAKKDLDTLKLFIKETCRAEIIHLTIMLSSLLFFIFAHWIIAVAMMGYAFLENIWCIMTQRYNRARLIKILKKYKIQSILGSAN
jgi:glycosyl-4,4'-diaponeurosporenoate acyltransferase